VLNPTERRTVAYHEMGHALVALACPGSDPVHKVSIIPRGIGALGYTMQRPTEDRYLATPQRAEHRMAVLLGGRAASSWWSARSPPARPTTWPRRHRHRARHGHPLRHGLPAGAEPGFDAAEATAREIDLAVRDLVEAADARARDILERRRADLEAGVELLLQREALTADEFPALRRADHAPGP
jgi:cell division protease FtsH